MTDKQEWRMMFAGMAMQGLLAGGRFVDGYAVIGNEKIEIDKAAFVLANSLLAEEAKQNQV